MNNTLQSWTITSVLCRSNIQKKSVTQIVEDLGNQAATIKRLAIANFKNQFVANKLFIFARFISVQSSQKQASVGLVCFFTCQAAKQGRTSLFYVHTTTTGRSSFCYFLHFLFLPLIKKTSVVMFQIPKGAQSATTPRILLII